jgi:Major intrinsic protein
MVMIYVGGHISGGHYNPAVTMAALVRRKIGIVEAVGYWIAQVTGGVAAGWIARAVVNPPAVATLTLAGHAKPAAAVAELVGTFALCYVMQPPGFHRAMRQEFDRHATATQYGPRNGRRSPVQGNKHSLTVGAFGGRAPCVPLHSTAVRAD